jgi:hypothetical protein
MDKKVKNTILLVLAVFVVVAVQQSILYSVDKGIGTGNVQAIAVDSDGHEIWSMGLIPHLVTMPKADALAQGLKTWASPGDYSGDAVMGITGAIAAVMWIVWLGVFLGFPGSMQLRKEKLVGLGGVALIVFVLNLVFLRAIADATTSGSVVKNTAGHLSLAINNTGILMAILLHRMGIGVKDPDVPMMPALSASKCDKAYSNFYRKFYGVIAILVVTGIIEVIFQLAHAGIPEVAVDASVWLIWGVIFIGHFGTFPSDWRLGKRPKGILLMLVLTVLTIVGFYVMQVATDESIGSGVMETRLANAGMSENAGLSLMMSCWLVFWTIAVGAAGFCDPGECKAPKAPAKSA